MKRRIGIIFMFFGALCVLFAGVLLFNNFDEDEKAGEIASHIIDEIAVAVAEENDEGDMPFFEIDGYRYIGQIYLPSIDIELPVMAEWDNDRLKMSPCRYYGSCNNNNLLIAAHNYNNHFGRLKYLDIGDPVIFTDANKRQHSYCVVAIELLQPTDISEMIDSGYDLTLFTCTPGGASRVTVRCQRAD